MSKGSVTSVRTHEHQPPKTGDGGEVKEHFEFIEYQLSIVLKDLAKIDIEQIKRDYQNIKNLIQELKNNNSNAKPGNDSDSQKGGCSCEEIKKIIKDEIKNLPKPSNNSGGGSGKTDYDYKHLLSPLPPMGIEDKNDPKPHHHNKIKLTSKNQEKSKSPDIDLKGTKKAEKDKENKENKEDKSEQ